MDTLAGVQTEPTASPSPGLLEIAHFWRTEENKALVAQIENQLISQGDDLSGDQHALLSLLLVDLGDWVGIEGRMHALEKTQEEESGPKEEESSP